MAVKTGMRLEYTLAFDTPIFLYANVQRQYANELQNTPRHNNGTMNELKPEKSEGVLFSMMKNTGMK